MADDAGLEALIRQSFQGHDLKAVALEHQGDGVLAIVEIDEDPSEALEKCRLQAVKALLAAAGGARANVALTRHQAPASPKPAGGALPGIAKVIAVASGKGGVGKSTTAVNLALALQALGLNVALLDADVYGPSVPKLLGLTGKPETKDKKLLPKVGHGLAVMSIGFLVDEDTPMVWRGPMVMSALTQMLGEVLWNEPSGRMIDVMVIDMPPGTGDAQLTIAQRVPLAGAVIVSTPQDLALIDAKKAIAMFAKVKVPILGLVENMSAYICPACGHEAHVFGHGGARAVAANLGVAFLGEVPLHLAIRETSDHGAPIVASAPESPQAEAYCAIAAQVAAILTGATVKPAPRIVYV